MKSSKLNRRNSAFTLVEALVVSSVVAVGAFLLLPFFARGTCGKAPRINCASKLKQIALAFRIWEGDHGDVYPMRFYTNELGTPLFANAANAFHYYQVMSNELRNPKLLICPEDKKKSAMNFTTDFNGSHISYFVALEVVESQPQSFLAGDSNLTNGTQIKDGILEVLTNQTAGWTEEGHQGAGNVALPDGSVQQFSPKYSEPRSNTPAWPPTDC